MIALCPHCHEPLRKPKRKRIRQALPGPSRAEKRKAKRETHREETAAIREARMAIAGSQCEFVVPGGGPRCLITEQFRERLHMHHLEGGNGRRRQRQTVESVRMLCEWHHREAHRASKRAPSPRGDERPQEKP